MKKFLLTAIATTLTLSMAIPAFAKSGYVFSVGHYLTGDPNIDTSQEAKDAANNLSNAGYSKKVVTSDISEETITFDWLDSDLVFLAGHGDNQGNSVFWIDDTENLNYRVSNYETGGDDLGRNVKDYDFENTKLAILSACNSGVSNGIAHSYELQGADAAIGWKDTVDDTALHHYTKTFTSYLGDGLTIQNAIKQTNADLLEEILPSSPVFNYQTYGQVYVPITNMRNKLSDYHYFQEKDNYIDISNFNYEYKNHDDSEIVTYIKENIDSDFEKEAFICNEVLTIPEDDSDLILTYRYQIEDIDTNFGYNVNIENNEVKGIWMVGEKIYNYDVPTTMSNTNSLADELKEQAIKDNNISDEVIEQNIIIYFDSNNKQMVHKVETVYQDEVGGIYCVANTY